MAVSNTGCDRGTLEERVAEAVGAGPAVVFVDLASGSCLFAVLKRLRERGRRKVVTGVNLAMLVDFVFHRTLPLDEAAARAAAIAGGEGDPGALMPIVLCRVDDRLVHGQVVIGWGRPLGIELIVLVDEGVAASAWEQELYRMAVPAGDRGPFRHGGGGGGRLDEWQASPARAMLLTGDVETMAALHRAAPAVVHRINLGGIHHRPGRRERLPYLYLTDDELRALEGARGLGRARSPRRTCRPPRRWRSGRSR